GGDDALEALAVLAGLDRVDVGPDELDVVLAEGAAGVQRDRGVQRGLAAERGQQRVRPLLRDHLLQDVGRDRLDVGGVGELRVGHDRRRVGVHQADPDALRLEDAAGLPGGLLGAVVLAGLAGRHRAAPIRAAKSSKRSTASCGPGAASGWYWTAKAGRSSSAMPSTTPSLRFTWVTAAAPKGVSNGLRAPGGTCAQVPPGSRSCAASGGRAAAKPWLWLVM